LRRGAGIGASITTCVMEIGESAGGRPRPSRRIKASTPSCASASGRSNGAIERPSSVTWPTRRSPAMETVATFIRLPNVHRSSLIGGDYRLFAIELKRKRFWESPP
jgi:hypothetical protein